MMFMIVHRIPVRIVFWTTVRLSAIFCLVPPKKQTKPLAPTSVAVL